MSVDPQKLAHALVQADPEGIGMMCSIRLARVCRQAAAALDDDVLVTGRGDTEADLRRMMRDPRYWREREPAFVAEVTSRFRALVDA